MGLLGRVLATFSKKNTGSQYGSREEADFWTKLSLNYPDPQTRDAFSVMAALRAGLVIAQGVGQVPLRVKHERLQGDNIIRRNAIEDRNYRLLNRRPNDWMTSVEFREALTLHAVFTGKGRALVRRGVDGRAIEYIPLAPQWVEPVFYRDEQAYIYELHIDDFGIHGRFTRDDIIEISNPRWDFINGLDITHKAATALGLAKNLEGRQAKLTERNSPYGIVTTKEGVSQDRVNVVKKAWVRQFGEGNGIGFLDFDATFHQMMGTAQDQQTIENRQFQIEEVARAYGVFPQMLMHADKTSTFASAEAFFNAHLVHTMQPWFNRWEQSLDRTLFDGSEHLRSDFDEQALIRMSIADRTDYYARALGSGGNAPWLTQNEVREEVGKNPIEGGNILFNPNRGQMTNGNKVP
ncbi:phage portal protein [Epibacterium ulvae]|uniref:phage portal protein n=1 Tax=Epibacterium ulvae TaxID=1156985 RepID=UPI0024900F77|nr:phage portal protein [Epibacterium ulvae]